MPVNSTAAVTARDGFVIAFDEQELLQRMQLFRDLSIPTSEIRRRFFTSGRSKKYVPGDTRGWKLEDARRIMAADTQWNRYARACLYRPFDRRVIYWADWMIDWPRLNVMQYMTRTKNLALVTRRQMLPHQPCNFFWVSDSIVIDGVIRSDNRGSESLFPLYLPDGTEDHATRASTPISANFAPQFVKTVEHATGLRWDPSRPTAGNRFFGPQDLLAYIYGLFHAPSYRQRYADWLCIDFPRVLLPHSKNLFRSLSRLGCRLIEQHIGFVANEGKPLTVQGKRGTLHGCGGSHSNGDTGAAMVGRGYPKHEGERILIDDNFAMEGVSPETWQFQVGGHQVCKKWLRDRRGRRLGGAEWSRFRQIVSAIQETQRCIVELDRQIDHHGGWPKAFSPRSDQ